MGPRIEPEARQALNHRSRSAIGSERPRVHGKSFYVGSEKFWVRGVTYGTFRPDKAGFQCNHPDIVHRDFERMVANGINTVRVYTLPPQWFLDAAQGWGLRVMIGIWWEQNIAFLDEPCLETNIATEFHGAIKTVSGHPAIFCYVVGNEIPAPIVRWCGARRVERYIEKLVGIVKKADPGALVTYVNYPTTEYLDLSFLDFVAFNVYLESPQHLRAYQARLQNLAGERPLIMGEIGFDSRRTSLHEQAKVLRLQVETSFDAGCAGVFVFAWTDEWYCGGNDIQDWDFGLLTRTREAKPALAAIRAAYTDIFMVAKRSWPLISIIICSYNGAGTIRDTLEGIKQLDYPRFEIIVVNDGSTDETPKIANGYECRLINTENCGLSSARNTGLAAANGEVVAYIDDDAYPDPQWLRYVAIALLTGDYVGVGGPNLVPEDDGLIAQCVGRAPGNPVHVLLTDEVAEHIPGCNMAFRKEDLERIGAFDVRYRTAGDDVDLCWRIQEAGWKLAFHPAAVVWHHRRNSIRAYWRQQEGYGRAEALLEDKWPERYNPAGHVTWSGGIYGNKLTFGVPLGRSRIYRGTWGTAPFQSLYQSGDAWTSIGLIPEWNLMIVALAGLSFFGLWWPVLLWLLPFLAIGILIQAIQAINGARNACRGMPASERLSRLYPLMITASLYFIQPWARLKGRMSHGLTLWRSQISAGPVVPWPRTVSIWREEWESLETSLAFLERQFIKRKTIVRRGGGFDAWDLEIRGGLFGRARLLATVEEHGAGQQYVRFGIKPWVSIWPLSLILGISALAITAAGHGLAVVPLVLAMTGFGFLATVGLECGRAISAALNVIHSCREYWVGTSRTK